MCQVNGGSGRRSKNTKEDGVRQSVLEKDHAALKRIAAATVENMDRVIPVASAGRKMDSIVTYFLNTPINTRYELDPYFNFSQGDETEISNVSSVSQDLGHGLGQDLGLGSGQDLGLGSGQDVCQRSRFV